MPAAAARTRLVGRRLCGELRCVSAARRAPLRRRRCRWGGALRRRATHIHRTRDRLRRRHHMPHPCINEEEREREKERRRRGFCDTHKEKGRRVLSDTSRQRKVSHLGALTLRCGGGEREREREREREGWNMRGYFFWGGGVWLGLTRCVGGGSGLLSGVGVCGGGRKKGGGVRDGTKITTATTMLMHTRHTWEEGESPDRKAWRPDTFSLPSCPASSSLSPSSPPPPPSPV